MDRLTADLLDQSIPLLLGIVFTLYAYGIVKIQPRKNATETQVATARKLLKFGGPFLILISLVQMAFVIRS